MKIGIIREEKNPPDSRVPLTPQQCSQIRAVHGIDLVVAPSPNRCYRDEEYQKAGVPLQEDLSDRTLLLGVKEVPIDKLVPAKDYFFFSHTIKEQVYNRKLLLAILEKKIRLLDYEVLTNEKGQRLIAFGRFAGMVGAHNGLLTYGRRTGAFDLRRMKDCYDYTEAKQVYQNTTWPAVRIVLTGTGRVASGAAMVLQDMGIQQVTPAEYLQNSYEAAVFTQLDCKDYAAHKEGRAFELQHFFQHPAEYQSIFAPYAQKSDVMINGIYWDNQAPAFFSVEDMQSSDFSIKVIADVTCDIAPVSSIPSTLRASTIADPIFGFDPFTGYECPAFQHQAIDMMTIDNLPNELPRDASAAFGDQFIEHILPSIMGNDERGILHRATVAQNGELGPHFAYLSDYVNG